MLSSLHLDRGMIRAINLRYTRILVRILGGEEWSLGSAPRVLAWFCLYIPVMGVNGVRAPPLTV